jgi:hypothetical protein
MPTKIGYLLHFVKTDGNTEESLYWRCDATSYEDAVHQLIQDVNKENKQVIFHELIKTSI